MIIHTVVCQCHDPVGLVGVHYHIVTEQEEPKNDEVIETGSWEGGTYHRFNLPCAKSCGELRVPKEKLPVRSLSKKQVPKRRSTRRKE